MGPEGREWGGGGWHKALVVGSASLLCGSAYWSLALERFAMTSRHPYYCGHPHCRGHPSTYLGGNPVVPKAPENFFSFPLPILSTLHPNTILEPNLDSNTHPNPQPTPNPTPKPYP